MAGFTILPSFGFSTKKETGHTSAQEEEEFLKYGSKGGSTSKQLRIDQLGMEKIMQDVLGGEQGLASIFAGEQSAGIFNSSVAAQASGDLIANLVGELAKLTAEEVTSYGERSSEGGTASKQKEGRTEGKTTGVDFGFGSTPA